MDTGAEISIIGSEMFQRIATRAKLPKKDFKQADESPLPQLMEVSAALTQNSGIYTRDCVVQPTSNGVSKIILVNHLCMSQKLESRAEIGTLVDTDVLKTDSEPCVGESPTYSISGLGGILSQKQSDGQLHRVAYASRALSPPEKNYGITGLETLAVVWALTHFQAYLYGHSVLVLTGHSTVKSVLEKPILSGKHARWWLKMYSSGINQLEI